MCENLENCLLDILQTSFQQSLISILVSSDGKETFQIKYENYLVHF